MGVYGANMVNFTLSVVRRFREIAESYYSIVMSVCLSVRLPLHS
jgi:hypothetical protein